MQNEVELLDDVGPEGLEVVDAPLPRVFERGKGDALSRGDPLKKTPHARVRPV